MVSAAYPADAIIVVAVQKGVYPYELDRHGDWADMMAATELPTIKCFHSTLTGDISAKDYGRARVVWDTLATVKWEQSQELLTFEDYHRFYLQNDVLLLAEVARSFQKTWWDLARIDPNVQLCNAEQHVVGVHVQTHGGARMCRARA